MASIQCANFSLSSRAQGSSLHLARPQSPIPWCSGAAWLRCRTGIRDPRALSSALDHTILGWGGRTLCTSIGSPSLRRFGQNLGDEETHLEGSGRA